MCVYSLVSFPVVTKYPGKSNIKERGVIWLIIPSLWEVNMAVTWAALTPIVKSREQWVNACALVLRQLMLHFYMLIDSSQELALPTVGESSHLIYAIKITVHRYSQGPISQVILDLSHWQSTLSSIKINIFFCLFVCLFLSLSIPGCSETHYVNQVGLELTDTFAFASWVLALKEYAITPTPTYILLIK